MNSKWTPMVAMACLTVLEATALIMGIDGALFWPVIVAIAGLGGFTVKEIMPSRRG